MRGQAALVKVQSVRLPTDLVLRASTADVELGHLTAPATAR